MAGAPSATAGDINLSEPPEPEAEPEWQARDWDVVSHTLWSLVPGVIIIVAVVLCLLEFLGLRNNPDRPGAYMIGRKVDALCIILVGSGAASLPMLEVLLEGDSADANANLFRVRAAMPGAPCLPPADPRRRRWSVI